MIKIGFCSAWNEGPEHLLKKYSIQTPKGDGVWENLKGISNLEEVDYCVMMGGASKIAESIQDGKKIVFQREPDYLLSSSIITNVPAKKHFTYANSYHMASWWIFKSFNNIEKMPVYGNGFSAIMSGKRFSSGHCERLNFLRKYCEKFPESIDVYGKGLDEDMPSYRGELEGGCKALGLAPYAFSLSCENGKIKNYMTEKIYDCFLCGTMPIYYGADNIFNFFPEDSIFYLNNFDEGVEFEVNERISKPLESKNIKAIIEAKRLVLYKYNLWPSIKRVIDTGEML